MTAQSRRWGVALFKDGKYEHRVSVTVTSQKDARVVAERYRKSHAFKYDYRAVEFDQRGYLVWQDGDVK